MFLSCTPLIIDWISFSNVARTFPSLSKLYIHIFWIETAREIGHEIPKAKGKLMFA